MTTQQQEQQPGQLNTRERQRKRISRRSLVIITVLTLAVVISVIWILSYLNVIPSFLASIFTIIITVLGAVFAFFQSMHLLIPFDKYQASETSRHSSENTYIPIGMPIASPSLEKTSYRGLVGFPPPTDARTIQQREQVVREVFAKLIQPDITALVLTGIGGVGKSTLAALIYRYAEEQRLTQQSPFQAEALWLTVDPAVTFADLAGNLFEVLDRPLPDLGNLAPQNQAVALFHALNSTDTPRLIILDQFENLLDWDTGQALTDRPGVGQWLDIINGQPCTCRILLTSRPRPIGTREYPPTYLQEYPVGGLEVNEGVALLRTQDVKGTEEELQIAVSRCAGHAFSLILLASLLRDHHMYLATLFKNTTLWIGDIATNLLDQIYIQRLTDTQRQLLLAFSIYREPILLDAALASIPNVSKFQIPSSLRALLTQHLLEAVGNGHYQLHAIIADYARCHFDEKSEQTNEEILRATHLRAARYYLQRAETTCPTREERKRISDVHDFIEATWHYCRAGQWQEAYDLIEREEIFADLNRWGGHVILQELYQPMLDQWCPQDLQAAHIYKNLGWTYLELGRITPDLTERALQICKELDDLGMQGAVLNDLGWIFCELGVKEKARVCAEQALDICRNIGNRRGESRALHILGNVFSDFGEKLLACEYYKYSLSIYKEIGDYWGQGSTANALGRVCCHLGQFEEAMEYLEQSLSIRREFGNRLVIGRTLKNMGVLYSLIGNQEMAFKYFHEALEISQMLGDRSGESKVLNNFGVLYTQIGKSLKARSFLEVAWRIRKDLGENRRAGITLSHLAQVNNDLGEKEIAMRYGKQALMLLRREGDRWWEGVTLHRIGTFYHKQENYIIALACFLHTKSIFEEIQNPNQPEIQKSIERLAEEVGETLFSILLAKVGSQAYEIIDQILSDGLQ